MNADRLLEHFERISDAADAVPRLRRFVLELAVQGRLTRPKDDSAPHCLTAKACSFPDADVWQIPTHWAFVELQQLAGSSGLLIDGDWVESKDQDPAGAIRLTQLADVGVGAFRDRSARFMNEETASRLGCTFLAPGDVLIARMPDPLGRACIFPGDKRPCVTVVDVAILRPNRDDIDPAFVVHAINSPVFAKNVAAKAAGTTRSRISRGNLAKLPFPLPPLAEQHSIVAKVDELMALCDRLETAQTEREARRDRLVSASLARVTDPDSDDATSTATSARFHLDHFARLTTRPAHVKQLRQSILNLAVRGRLVPQDPEDESAADFLRRLKEASDVSRKPRTLAYAASGASESPYQIPRGWAWTPFGSLINDSDSGWSPKTEGFTRIGDNWGVLKVSAVSWDTFLPEENKQLLPGVSPPERAVVHNGDFLISRANTSALIAKCVVVEQCPARLIMSDKIVRLAVVEGMSKQFLFIVNNYAQFARNHYAANATGTSLSMKNVSRDVIYNLPIPLPPLAEQRRIVAKVDELMALCDRLEACLASAATDRARLLEALLHKALAPVE